MVLHLQVFILSISLVTLPLIAQEVRSEVESQKITAALPINEIPSDVKIARTIRTIGLVASTMSLGVWILEVRRGAYRFTDNINWRRVGQPSGWKQHSSKSGIVEGILAIMSGAAAWWSFKNYNQPTLRQKLAIDGMTSPTWEGGKTLARVPLVLGGIVLAGLQIMLVRFAQNASSKLRFASAATVLLSQAYLWWQDVCDYDASFKSKNIVKDDHSI